MNYSKEPLVQWVYEKLTGTQSLEVMNILKELYEDFNLQEVDPRSITPTDIVGMYEELHRFHLVKESANPETKTPQFIWAERNGTWEVVGQTDPDGARL